MIAQSSILRESTANKQRVEYSAARLVAKFPQQNAYAPGGGTGSGLDVDIQSGTPGFPDVMTYSAETGPYKDF